MWFRAIVLVMMFGFVQSETFASELKFITHSIQGKHFVDESGEKRGIPHAGRRAFQLEIVREMMIIVGHSPRKIDVMPFKRAFLEIQKKPNLALFNVARRPSREGKVKWVAALQVDTPMLYEAIEFPQAIKSLDDAKKVDKVCVKRGTSHDTFVTKNDFPNIHRTNSYDICFNLLVLGKVNLAISADTGLPEVLKVAKISGTAVRPVLRLFQSTGYLTMSNNVPDVVIKKWQDAFDSLQQSGRYEQLYKKYFLPE